jgi:hypothetical protein
LPLLPPDRTAEAIGAADHAAAEFRLEHRAGSMNSELRRSVNHGTLSMIRRIIPIMLIGVLSATPALATSAPATKPDGAATTDRPSLQAVDRAGDGAAETVKAACNPRRPSCRKRQALDAQRMENAKNDE